MKKILVFLSIIFLLPVEAVGVDLWQTAGSNIYYQGGNVGVGTADPISKLQVNGRLRVQDATALSIQFDGEDGSVFWGIGTSGANNDNSFALYNNKNGSVPIYVSDVTDNITFSSKVGINTFYPESQVHIGGNNKALRLDYNGTNDYFGNLRWAGLQLGNNGENRLVAGRTSLGGYFNFYVNNTNDASDYLVVPDGKLALTINSNGNVGIGDASPDAKLDILQASDEENQGLQISRSNDTDYTRIYKTPALGSLNDPLVFSSAYLANHAGIDRVGNAYFAGNVGVGTTTPTEKFEVNGKLKIKDGIVSDGDICIGVCD